MRHHFLRQWSRPIGESAPRAGASGVVGIGRTNTPEAVRKACKRFIFVENLLGNGVESRERGDLGQCAPPVPKTETGGDSGRSEPEGESGKAAAPGEETTREIQSVQKERASKPVPLIMAATRSHDDDWVPLSVIGSDVRAVRPDARSEILRIQEARRLHGENGPARGEAEQGAGAGADEAVAVRHRPRKRNSQGLGPKKRCKRMSKTRSSFISHSQTTKTLQPIASKALRAAASRARVASNFRVQ